MLFLPPRAFTLIELLVVIAIIGILSSVVLAALNTARMRAADTKVSSEMASLRSGINIYYAQNGSYGNAYGSGSTSGACPATGAMADSPSMLHDTTTGIFNIIRSLRTSNGVTVHACYVTARTWAVAVNRPSAPTTEYYCADSNGNTKIVTGTLAANTLNSTLCP